MTKEERYKSFILDMELCVKLMKSNQLKQIYEIQQKIRNIKIEEIFSNTN